MRQLDRREDRSSSLFGNLLKRLRGLATGESDNGGLRETLEDLLEEGAPQDDDDPDHLTAEQRSLLLNALSFGELRVEDVMIPRADIKAVEAGASLAEVVEAMRECGHSQLIVYRDKLDDVVGIVNIKDLLAFWGDGESFELIQVMRKVLVVPSSMRVLDLLIELRDTRSHMAVVVDEFGGTDGLVTVEDLVHEILGEIHDEHAPEPEPDHEIGDDGEIEVDARIDLEDLEDLLGWPLHRPEDYEEVDTLAGLIFVLIDRIPEIGETVVHPDGWELDILDADPRRIKRVRIRKPQPSRATTPDHT